MYPHERSLVNSMQSRPFSLLGVNNDEEISVVSKAVKENELNWRSWIDGNSGPIVKNFEIRSFPTIFLVDHKGVIRYKNLRGAKLDHAIELLVAEAEQDGAKGGIVVAPPKLRRFVDKTGKHKIMAKFESFADGEVTLVKSSGEKSIVPLDSLSQKDHDYLENGGYLEETTNTSAAATNDASESRVFTDKTGKHKVSATFVKLDGNNVTLLKEDGSNVDLPLDKLCEEDQAYVKKAADEEKVADEE